MAPRSADPARSAAGAAVARGPRRRVRAVAALLALLALALCAAACGSSGHSSGSSAGSTTAAASSSPSTKPVLVINVNVPPNAPYSSSWKLGADQAAKDLGNVTDEWLAPNDLNNPGPDLAQLERTAIARHPDALIVADYLPDAQRAGIRAAVKAGIPTWEANGGGQFNWQKDGALGFFVSDEKASGALAGKLLSQAGVTKGLCVNSAPGNPGTSARCAGFASSMTAAGGSAKQLTIPLTDESNPIVVTQDIRGALASDHSIDGLYTLGTGDALYALKALQQSGLQSKVKVGTADLSIPVLKAVRDGQLVFAIDQQTYLQGYLSVVAAVEWKRYGLRPVGVVATGPLAVLKNDAPSVLALSKQGVRGAG